MENTSILLITTGNNRVRKTLAGNYPFVEVLDCIELSRNQLIDRALKSTSEMLITYRCPYIIPSSCYSGRIHGGYNIHPSLLPKYKGLNPWEEMFRNKERKGGVTIHRLSDETDSGEIISQVGFEIIPEQSLEIARYRADELASYLINEFINKQIIV